MTDSPSRKKKSDQKMIGINVSVPADLKEIIEQIAGHHDRSYRSEIVHALRWWAAKAMDIQPVPDVGEAKKKLSVNDPKQIDYGA